MNKLFPTLTLTLLLAACGQNTDDGAASSASASPSAASQPAAGNTADHWITDNGEKTNALPEPASAPASAPIATPASAIPPVPPADGSAAAAGTKLAPACEALIDRMAKCYDRLPAESAGEMKATLADIRLSLADTDNNVCKTTMTEEFNSTAAALGCE